MIEHFPNQPDHAWLIFGEQKILARVEKGLWVATYHDEPYDMTVKNESLEKLHDFIAQAMDILEDARNPVDEDSFWHRMCLSFADAVRFELANIWHYLFALISLIFVAMFFPLNNAFEMTCIFLLLVLIFRGNKP